MVWGAECLEREREVVAHLPAAFNMTELSFRFVDGMQVPGFSANITAAEVRPQTPAVPMFFGVVVSVSIGSFFPGRVK